MAQQGKQVRVGARKCFPCNSLKVVLLANCERYEVDWNAFFLVAKPSIDTNYLPAPTLTFITHI
jgi:hypothetical protein